MGWTSPTTGIITPLPFIGIDWTSPTHLSSAGFFGTAANTAVAGKWRGQKIAKTPVPQGFLRGLKINTYPQIYKAAANP